MNTWPLNGYLMEMRSQCEYAMMAIEDIQKLIDTKEFSNRFWYSIQSFLIAARNIRYLLWPAEESNPRGSALRKHIGIPDDSSLKDDFRKMTNHFLHFDERLDCVVKSNGGIVDTCIGLGRTNIKGPNLFFLRNYDPKTNLLTFLEDQLDFVVAVKAVCEIREAVARLEVHL